MILALVTALLVGFASLIVLFAPFLLSGELSEQERRYDVRSEEQQPRQTADDPLNYAAR